MIQIRTATMEDYEAICQLTLQVDQLHIAWYPEYFRLPQGPSRERIFIQTWHGREESEIFLALDESGLVGLLMIVIEVFPDFPIMQAGYRKATVDNLVVEQNNQGRGIGKQLMEAAEVWARQQKAQEMSLQVYEKNQKAQAFYRQLDFEPVSQLMRKKI